MRDAPRLAVLVIEGFESYLEFAPAGWSHPTVEEEAERVAATLAMPSAWCELAEDATRQPVGHVGWLAAHSSRRPTDDDGLAHFWQLFLRRAWWGSGLATELHGRGVAAAAQHGYTTMRLFTPTGQARARRFYEREGWSVVDELVDDAFGMPIVEYRRAL